MVTKEEKPKQSYHQRLLANAVAYSNYGYGIYHAAKLAATLKLAEISVIEFGVAGGNGLVAMEAHAKRIARKFGVAIQVYGFDTGEGLTPPQDYRDMPYRFTTGNYKMDVPKLEARLTGAKLVIGDVKKTVPAFFATHNPAPIGFVSFDMDYYSSTMDAFAMFGEANDEKYFIPRMQLYFDDIVGSEISSYNEFVGELAAIKDFNTANTHVKIAENRTFQKAKQNVGWYHQIYLMHRFRHPLYDVYISESGAESLALR